MQTSTAKPRSSSSSLTTAPARSERTTRQRPVELALCAAHHCAIACADERPSGTKSTFAPSSATARAVAWPTAAIRSDVGNARSLADRNTASCSTLAALVTNSHS
jgi:hypothetical protein